jgi:hypothetical protein
VVLAAIAAARRDGAEFVFLVADYEDWPKELYRRLGFDELGYYLKFIKPAEAPLAVPPQDARA